MDGAIDGGTVSRNAATDRIVRISLRARALEEGIGYRYGEIDAQAMAVNSYGYRSSAVNWFPLMV